MNSLTIELCERKNKFIINNLYPLYLHDLAEIRNVEHYKFLEKSIIWIHK